MGTVALSVPDLPVTVRLALPAAALADAESVSVLAPFALTALNVPVTPVGSPVTLSATLPENPF